MFYYFQIWLIYRITRALLREKKELKQPGRCGQWAQPPRLGPGRESRGWEPLGPAWFVRLWPSGHQPSGGRAAVQTVPSSPHSAGVAASLVGQRQS